jgi:hypothetical protein
MDCSIKMVMAERDMNETLINSKKLMSQVEEDDELTDQRLFIYIQNREE